MYACATVTYWPRPSCQKKKCTCVNNRCIRSKISGDNLDCRQVELSTNVTLARSRWVSNYYITPATGSSDQLEWRCWNEEPCPSRSRAPRAPVEQPRKTRKLGCDNPNSCGVNMLLFCSVSNSHSHTTLSIKWEVYFSKELCPLVFIVLNMFLHAYVYV